MGRPRFALLRQRADSAASRSTPRCWIGPVVLLVLLIILFFLLPNDASAEQMREWKLADRTLHSRTTAALSRYYMFVRADSLRLRYLRSNAQQSLYKLRGRVGANDSLGQIVSIALGQLVLYPATAVRVALGEELYNALVASRMDAASEERMVIEWDNFGHEYWENGNTGVIALDRADWRITPMLGAFAQIGAPESNLHWWSDATWRFGLTAPTWELGVLMPFSGGVTGVGPLRRRLLSPGYGASAIVRAGSITGRARFTGLGTPAFESTPVADNIYVHTLSGQVTYSHIWETSLGTIRGDIGAGYEQFTRAHLADDIARADSTIDRFSPLADLTWISAQGNMRASIGWGDMTPRAMMGIRLTELLWLEARLAGPGVFRDRAPFEHPAYVFITPRVKL